MPLLRRAVGTWQAQDAPHEVAKLNVLIVQACRALADRDGARLQFSAARETFERLGARPDLAQLDRIVAATDAGSGTHGLTPREIEVLCLIARGKANRAIANELHLHLADGRDLTTWLETVLQDEYIRPAAGVITAGPARPGRGRAGGWCQATYRNP